MISNQENLKWQFEWAGTQLINKRILVSDDELDIPQRQLGTIILPADPPSIINARPEPYFIDEPVPPTYTFLSADVLAGNTALPVESVTDFTIGDNVLVQLADGIFGENTIVTIDTLNSILNVNLALSANAPSGGTVTVATLTPPPP